MKKILALSLVLVLICSVFVGCRGKQTDNGEFQKPDDYAAVVHLKINPEFNIYVDDTGIVLKVEPLNDDAVKVTDKAEVEGKTLSEAANELVNVANQEGLLKVGAIIEIEITEIKNSESSIVTDVENLSKSVKDFTDTLNIEVTVNVSTQTTEDTTTETSSNATTETPNSPAQSSQPAQSSEPAQSSQPAQSSEPEESREPTETSSTTTTSQPANTETVVDPSGIIEGAEYIGNFEVGSTSLSAALLQFDGGGVMFGTRYFTTEKPEPDATVAITYKGTEYYSEGAGFNGNEYQIEGKQIVIRDPGNASKIIIKAELLSSGKLTIVYSDMEDGSLFKNGIVLEPNVKKVD